MCTLHQYLLILHLLYLSQQAWYIHQSCRTLMLTWICVCKEHGISIVDRRGYVNHHIRAYSLSADIKVANVNASHMYVYTNKLLNDIWCTNLISRYSKPQTNSHSTLFTVAEHTSQPHQAASYCRHYKYMPTSQVLSRPTHPTPIFMSALFA